MPSPGLAPRRRAQRGGVPLLAVALALSIAAALPYLAAGGLDGFINLDDDSYVYENPAVLGGLTAEGVRWAFTSFHASNWHPLTWLSHMTDVTLFGRDARGHHLVNVLLHSLSTLLLFLALARMTAAPWRSALAAALFGVHPLHVESVAWVAERKDVLSGFIFMLVLLAYERYARRGGRWRSVLVALLLALGLMAKPMLVTVPWLLLLLDLWPLGRVARRGGEGGGRNSLASLMAEKAPLLALTSVSVVITWLAQKSGGAMKTFESVGADLRLANACTSLVAYIGKALWPLSLAVHYPFPASLPPWWKVVGALLATASVTVAAIHLRRRPAFLVGWLWYLGTLVPVIGLVQVGAQSMADRYSYLPLIGLFIAAVWGAADLLRGRGRVQVVGVSAGMLLILAAMASRQTDYWKDATTLYTHALAVAPGSGIVHHNLARSLAQAGHSAEAIFHYREALRLQPDYVSLPGSVIHNNLANSLVQVGRIDEAISHYREAIRLQPDYARARVNLGIALGRGGRPGEAVAQLREALRIRPEFAEAHYCLGIAFEQLGRREEAVFQYREALRIQADFPGARYNLGTALLAMGLREEGTRQLELAKKSGGPAISSDR